MLRTFSPPSSGTFPIYYTCMHWLDPDTDGDGIADGADDQDHDGYTNIEESRPVGDPTAPPSVQAESVWHYPVEDDNPNIDAFNPCLPNDTAPACPRHPVTSYAPFLDSSPSATFHVWPRP